MAAQPQKVVLQQLLLSLSELLSASSRPAPCQYALPC